MSNLIKLPPAPGSKEWGEIITASKVPAMITDKTTGLYLGLGYYSAYEMYAQMKGEWEEDLTPDKQAMFDDAHDAEDYAVNVWKRANPGWRTGKGEVAFSDPTLPFPNLVTLDRRASRGRARRIIEVKRPRVSRGVTDGWLVQVTFQMGVSKIYSANLVEVPVYGKPVIHRVPFDQTLFDVIVSDAERFYQRLQLGIPPEMEGSEHERQILSALNPVNNELPPHRIDESLMVNLKTAWDELDAAQKRVNYLESVVADNMGKAPQAICGDRPVARRIKGRFSQARVPAEHKDLLKDESLMSLRFDAKKLKEAHPDVYEEALGSATYRFARDEWKED